MTIAFVPKKEEIGIKWHFTDVLSVRPKLTDDQAMIVLGNLEHDHDATIGVNWDVIADTADMLFPTD